MRKTVQIGEKIFKYKKDALSHYRTILNSYSFGQSLNDRDFDELIDLLQYDPDNQNNQLIQEQQQIGDTSQELEIVDIKVSKVQFSTKCFEFFWNDNTSEFISYILRINRPKENFHATFSTACRNCIQDDLIALKQGCWNWLSRGFRNPFYQKFRHAFQNMSNSLQN